MTWEQMVEIGYQWYLENCGEIFSESDCMNMAIRDADAELDML